MRADRRTRLAASLAAVVALAVPAGAHAAADGHERAPQLPKAVEGGVVVLHYTTDGAGAIPDGVAQELHGDAERAYAAMRADFGMPPHVGDQDGRIDVYVYDLQLNPATAAAITSTDDSSARRSSSYIRVKAPYAMRSGAEVLAHELMHVLQFSVVNPASSVAGPAEFMLHESTAALAAVRHAEARLPISPLGVALDEVGAGRVQWSFFESIAEDHGGGVIGAIFEQEDALAGEERVGRPLEAIEAALSARGSSLGAAVTAHAARWGSGRFTLPYLSGVDVTPGRVVTITPGRRAAQPLRTVAMTLPRRSYQLIGFTPRKRKPCDTRTLEITVRVPDGAAAPVLALRPGSAVTIPVRAGRAVLKRTWKPCTSRAMLVLTNPTGADGLAHEVRSRLLKRPSKRR